MPNSETTSNTRLTRRAAIAGTIAGLATASALGDGHDAPKGTTRLPGWDAAKGEYVLPPLPYAPDALEPHIDAETMRIHHGRHHAGYVRGLNRALQALASLRAEEGDAAQIARWSKQVSFHGSGHVNHTLFWHMMAPPSTRQPEPTGALADAVRRDFGSLSKCLWQFRAAARTVEASGWAWLVHEPIADRLLIIQGEKQQDLMMTGVSPLLGIDVWEHAYYLRYQNRRADYVDAFQNVINWAFVEQLFGRARA